MSSLSAQLSSIRSLDAARLSKARPEVPSYLFAARQAASQTNADIHALGHNGFLALIPHNDQDIWGSLEEPLFGEAAKQIDRTLLDKAENAKLDAQIESLLRLLGPHVLLRLCGQVLEWLIRRFRVHEFNARSVLALFLPYHETPQFVQMLQLLAIEHDPVLSSLSAVKSAQQILPRHILVSLMSKSTDMLRFVTLLLPQSLAVSASHRALVAFWTTTLVAFVDHKRDIAPGEMAVLLPASLDVLRKGDEDSKLAAYIVLSRLSTKVSFTDDALETLITRLLQSRSIAHRDAEAAANENDEAMLGTLAIICAEQEEVTQLPDKAVAALLQIPDIEEQLVQLSSTCDMTTVLRPLARSLANGAAAGGEKHTTLLLHLLHRIHDNEVLRAACNAVIDAFSADVNAKERLLPLLTLLHQRHPATLDACTSTNTDEVLREHLQAAIAEAAQLDMDDATLLSTASGGSSALQATALRTLLADDTATAEHISGQLAAHLRRYDLAATKTIFEHPRSPQLLEADMLLDIAAELFSKADAPRLLLSAYATFIMGSFLPHTDPDEIVMRVFWPKLLAGKATKKSVAAVYAALRPLPIGSRCLFDAFSGSVTAEASAYHNGALSKALAVSISAQPELLRDRVKRMIGHFDTKGAASLLSKWVLIETCDNLKRNMPYEVVGDIMLALFMKGLSPIGSATSASVPEALVDSIFSKPGSSKTVASLNAHLLIAVFACLRKPEGVIPWLKPNEETQNDAAEFRKAAGIAYQLARSVSDETTASLLMRSLFTCLDSDGALFLVTGAVRSDWSERLRSISIRDAALVLHESAGDALLVVIASVPLLQANSKVVRQAAVALLHRAQQAIAKVHLPINSAAYGQEGELAQLTTAEAQSYLSELIDRESEIIVTTRGLAAAHEALDRATKRAVLLLYLSHAKATTDMERRLHMLEAVDAVSSKQRLSASLPLLRDAAKDVESLDTPERDRYLSLLFRAFDKPGKALESGDGLQLLESFVSGSTGASLQAHAISTLRHGLYKDVSVTAKLQLLRAALKALISDVGSNASSLHNCLHELVADFETVKSYLDAVNSSFTNSGNKSEPAAKRSKVAAASESGPTVEEVSLLLEALGSVDLAGAPHLLSPLFTLAARFADILSQANVPFAAQLAVGVISSILASTADPTLLAEHVRVDVVIVLLKDTTSPALGRRSLLLLSQLTDIVSTQVVPHVMPIFTFLGHNMLSRDDAASLRVIEQTLDSILPPLVRSVRASAADRHGVLLGLRDVMTIFTSASVHVPRHKRLPIYSRLASVLGPHDFLGALCMLQVDQQATKLAKTESKGSQARDLLEVPLGVLASFAPRHQLMALSHVIDEICLHITQEASRDRTPFLPPQLSGRATPQKRVIALSTFLDLAVTSKQLASKVDSSRAQGFQDLDVGLQDLAKKIIVAMSPATPDASLTEADLADLAIRLRQTLQSLVALTAPSVFSEIVLWLADSTSLPIVLNALALLRQQLPLIRSEKRKDVAPANNAVLRRLSSLLSKPGIENAKQATEILQTASVIATLASSEEHAALTQVLMVMLEVGQRSTIHHRIARELLSALSAFPAALGPRMLQQIKPLVELALRFLSGADTENAAAAYALLQKLVEALPSFSAPTLAPVLLVAFGASDSPAARDKFLTAAAKNVPASALLPTLQELWEPLPKSSTSSLVAYLQFVTRIIRQTKPDAFNGVYKAIFRLLLSVFDYRRLHKEGIEPEEIALVEKAAVAAFVQMTLKLSDNAFRPLFLRAIDWALVDLADADEDEGRQDRAVALFRLIDRMLAQLKEVISPYYAFLLDSALEFLERQLGDSAISLELWQLVASSLTHALLHGVDGYWTASRLQRLIAPCVSQLRIASKLGPSSTSSFAGPLVVQLALTCAEHEAVLKQVNTAIIGRLRDDSDETAQIAAVRTLEAVWQALGEQMSAHVPETLPIILELLEGEPAVERATRTLVQTMEGTMGESLLDAV